MVILRCLLLLVVFCLLSTPGTWANKASKSNDVIISSSNDVRQPHIGPDVHSRKPFLRVIRSPKRSPRKGTKTVKTQFSKNTPGTSQYQKSTAAFKLYLSKFPNSAKKAKVQNKVSSLFRSASHGSVSARKSLKLLLPSLLGFGTAGAGLATAITQLLAVTRDQRNEELPTSSVSPLTPGEIQSLMQELGSFGSGAVVRKNDIIVSAVCALLTVLCEMAYCG